MYQDGIQAVECGAEDKTLMSEQTETIKLQHRQRRGGTLNVNGTVYQVGDDGSVDLAPEHAAKVLQGAMWKPFGQWGAQRQALSQATPTVRHGARLPRTKAQLQAAAVAGGEVAYEDPPAPRIHQPATHAPPAPEHVAEATGQLPPDANHESEDQPDSQPEASDPPAPAAQSESAPDTPPVKSTAITNDHPGTPPEGAQTEEIPVSANMTKAALLDAASKAGIQVDANMTKAEILSTIEAASQ